MARTASRASRPARARQTDDFEYGLQLGFALMFGAVLLLVGLVLIATLLLWFVGIAFVLASGYPLYRVEMRRIRQRTVGTAR